MFLQQGREVVLCWRLHWIQDGRLNDKGVGRLIERGPLNSLHFSLTPLLADRASPCQGNASGSQKRLTAEFLRDCPTLRRRGFESGMRGGQVCRIQQRVLPIDPGAGRQVLWERKVEE
jgi:hypothetical protein